MDKTLFKKIAGDVEEEWKMGGLSDGIYYDYALEIARRYFSTQPAVEDGRAEASEFCAECKDEFGHPDNCKGCPNDPLTDKATDADRP